MISAKPSCCLAVFIIGLLLLMACDNTVKTTTVSEAPAPIELKARTKVTAHQSQIALRAKISYDDFAELVRQQIPAEHKGAGSERKCERVIGLKVCGTADWQFTVYRSDNIKVAGEQDKIKLSLPISFKGVAGIQGDVAKALGLSKLDFNGALDATISIGLDLDSQWCPVITTELEYNWTQTPKVKWAGAFDLDIKKYLDEEIEKQLAKLPDDINESIDCTEFRADLSEHWRNYSFPLDLAELTLAQEQTLYLNLVPEGFGFSGVRTDENHLGVTFVLEASTTVESSSVSDQSIELPDLKTINYEPGKTEFELLVRADYTHLQALAEAELIGQTFTSHTALGPTTVTVSSIKIEGATSGITIAIAFDADLPATRSNTPGIVHLTAMPVVDALNQKISLEDIALTKVLDSTLWDSLATVFEVKIISAIRKSATLDFKKRIEQLELQLTDQLSNTANTGGIEVQADDIAIRILTIQPEADALAIVLQANASLDLNIPLSALSH